MDRARADDRAALAALQEVPDRVLAGQEDAARAIAVEYATFGIRANAVLPGATLTPMVEREIRDAPDPEHQRFMINGLQPMKRSAQPAEIAAAVAFLLSDDASFMTGASVPVDGGILAGLPGPDVLAPEELGSYWRDRGHA